MLQLESLGVLHNTYVVYASDNGYHIQNHNIAKVRRGGGGGAGAAGLCSLPPYALRARACDCCHDGAHAGCASKRRAVECSSQLWLRLRSHWPLKALDYLVGLDAGFGIQAAPHTACGGAWHTASA